MRYQNPAHALEAISRADAELQRLCEGGRFTMCIPAEPDRDSDLVIGEALSVARQLAEDMAVLHRLIAELKGDDPSTWPEHGNAPLAMAARLALLVMDRDQGPRT